jgi:hypothetical protein
MRSENKTSKVSGSILTYLATNRLRTTKASVDSGQDWIIVYLVAMSLFQNHSSELPLHMSSYS